MTTDNATQAETLLPCPWCNGSATLRHDNDPNYPVSISDTHDEPCPLGFHTLQISYPNDATATAAWNTRAFAKEATPSASVERMRNTLKIIAGGDLRTDFDQMTRREHIRLARAALTLPVPSAPQYEWQPMATAPRDDTLIELVVDYSADDADHPLADGVRACTIGFNGFDNHGDDEWKFAGWCWSHDHFVQGKGTPIAWRPSRLNATDDALAALPDMPSAPQGGE